MPSKTEADKRVAWLKAVQSIDKTAKQFMTRIDDLNKLTIDGLQEIENERDAAQAALDADMIKIDADHKRKKLDLELSLERTQRAGAVEILTKSGEEPILTAKREQMEKLIAELQATNEKAIAEAEERVRRSLTMTHKMELERTKLTHEKDQATVTETNKALQRQIEEKNRMLVQMREDNVRMQELVQGVAEAGSKTVYMPSSK